MADDLKTKYGAEQSAPAFSRLYGGDPEFGHMFAVLHERLNQHFADINGRARSTHHYWADNSRDLISLIDDLDEELGELGRAGITVVLDGEYRQALERCKPWLSPGGGSPVPEDFEQIPLIRHQPVFSRPATTVRLQKHRPPVPRTLRGEGSYALVFSYVDPDYGIKFALKRAKPGISERDLARFKQEFAVMKQLHFPYVVQVYRYDDAENEYCMEYCDATLRDFIARRNSMLSFTSRKRIALQFLYGMNFIHSRKLLHRDVSLQNVLLKVFEDGAVLVKLSDFGLVKEADSSFTRTHTELRGTIRDPQLTSLKDYSTVNEIYSIGWVLSYIFTGRESLSAGSDGVGRIVQRCTAHDTSQRYQTALEVIADVEKLESNPSGVPA
jgi:eukaryotic-like serine/threonine-protein kinase